MGWLRDGPKLTWLLWFRDEGPVHSAKGIDPPFELPLNQSSLSFCQAALVALINNNRANALGLLP
jgi:hypothetical protein